MISTLVTTTPFIAMSSGCLVIGLYVALAARAVRTGVRLGQVPGDPRQTRQHAPALFWGTIVLFGFIMVRSGVKFIEYGLIQILAP